MSLYGCLTVGKLKHELRCRGATTRGRKADLIERLESYDRNDNFRRKEEEVVLPNSTPSVFWPTRGFQQLLPSHQATFPDITHSDVEAYFRHRLAVDNEEAGDFKAIEKGTQLLKSNHVVACSVVYVEGNTYISGLVSAAMKKKVNYSFKAMISGCGDVVNTHCECPAGKGPHGTCKHLAAVLLMTADFKSKGNILIRRSCTDRLQTFHRPKKEYSDSPKKAEDLGMKRAALLDDPRPVKFRRMEGYQDHVRNTTINYCNQSNQDLTVRYLFDRADLHAATHDHHYLERPFSEYWVDKALEITDQQAQVLEKNTRKQSKCTLWHDERRWRLTASNFGTLCKCTSRRNKITLCKTLVSCKRLVCKAIRHGIQHEERAISQVESVCNVHVKKCGMFVLPQLPFLAATPDGVVDSETIVEVKCPYSGRNEKIVPGKLFPYLNFRKGTIALKENSNYYFQVQGQLFLSSRKHCLFAVYTFKDFFVQKIALDEEYCRGSIVPKLSLFFESFLRPYIAKHCIC